jgi:hypothetical protein
MRVSSVPQTVEAHQYKESEFAPRTCERWIHPMCLIHQRKLMCQHLSKEAHVPIFIKGKLDQTTFLEWNIQEVEMMHISCC